MCFCLHEKWDREIPKDRKQNRGRQGLGAEGQGVAVSWVQSSDQYDGKGLGMDSTDGYRKL